MKWGKRLGGLAGLWLIAACAATPIEPQSDVPLLRNPTAPVGSQTDVRAQDLEGDWTVRQAIPGQWPMTAERVRFGASEEALGLVPLDGADQINVPTTYTPTLPGRFVAVSAVPSGLPTEIWVYWMDIDRRTAAIGDPTGGFVAILDRSAIGGEDRIVAARDILNWYGYDLAQLRGVAP